MQPKFTRPPELIINPEVTPVLPLRKPPGMVALLWVSALALLAGLLLLTRPPPRRKRRADLQPSAQAPQASHPAASSASLSKCSSAVIQQKMRVRRQSASGVAGAVPCAGRVPGGSGQQRRPHRTALRLGRGTAGRRGRGVHCDLRPPIPPTMPTDLELDILPQPDDDTCGPTCLQPSE